MRFRAANCKDPPPPAPRVGLDRPPEDFGHEPQDDAQVERVERVEHDDFHHVQHRLVLAVEDPVGYPSTLQVAPPKDNLQGQGFRVEHCKVHESVLVSSLSMASSPRRGTERRRTLPWPPCYRLS